jgi:transporter family protein
MPDNRWIPFALGSAFFAALTALFGKLGVAEIPSNLATFLRTLVILALCFGIAASQGELGGLRGVSGRTLSWLVLSGLATGASWLCYYHALKLGPASRVAPVDKLSVVFVVVLALLFLGEKLSLKAALGCLLIAAGSVLMALA